MKKVDKVVDFVSDFGYSLKRCWKARRFSSVGRAKDWKSLCPWFDSWRRHYQKTPCNAGSFFLCSAWLSNWWWKSIAGTVLKGNSQYPDVQDLKFWYSFQSHAWSWACTKMTYDVLLRVTGTKCPLNIFTNPWSTSQSSIEQKIKRLTHWALRGYYLSRKWPVDRRCSLQDFYSKIATSKIGMELVAIIFYLFSQ